LAGLAGILLYSISGLDIDRQVAIVVPALAAALVGGFKSYLMTFAGGLLVGVVESEAIRYSTTGPGWSVGLSSAAPLLVILLVLLVRGRVLPLRSFQADRLPGVGTGQIRFGWVVGATVLSVASLFVFSDSWVAAMTTAATFGVLALSLVLLVGYAGQVSLTQWSLAGVGALFAGHVAAEDWSMPMLLAMLIGIVFTTAMGLVIAAPALRVRGANLAVVTLALGIVIDTMILNNPAYTGGAIKGTVVPTPSIFGLNLSSVEHGTRYAIFCIVSFVVCALLVANIRRGGIGRRLIAVRANERAAASLGINIVHAKAYAFGVGSGLAAITGALVAFRNPSLEYSQFDLNGNINALLFGVIGGIGYLGGAIVSGVAAGGSVIQFLIGHVVDTTGWYVPVAALILVVTTITQPNGFAAVVVGGLARLRRQTVRTRQPIDVSSIAVQRVEPRMLTARDVTVRFGKVVAVDSVSFTVHPGEIVGLIGPNGAGKTTLIEAISGFVSYRGDIELDGRALRDSSASQRARGGISRTFQSLELIDELSVLDNLRIAADPGSMLSLLRDPFWPRIPKLSPAALAAIRDFKLTEVLDAKPDDLSYAQRRLVSIARSVSQSPSVLLLDEPTAGLDEASTDELVGVIQRLAREWGMAVLLIEHDVAMVARTCDRIIALEFGALIAEGRPDHVLADQAVVEAYLGAHDGQSVVISPRATS
jgi:sulfate-transporting ATPase